MYLLVKYLLCPLLTKLSLFLSSPPFSMQREITHSSPSSVFLKGRGEGGSAFWYVNSTLLTLLYLLTHPNALNRQRNLEDKKVKSKMTDGFSNLGKTPKLVIYQKRKRSPKNASN